MSTPAKPEASKPERKRQDWLIVLLILLLGFVCVLVAGQYALRFSPTWQADTNMESNIDLNSQLLTGKPQDFFEPVDPAILTQPAWSNIFLTPGASIPFINQTPLPTSPNANTEVPTLIGTTAVPTNTVAVTNTTVPTNTLVWIPLPNTPTRRPPPANTPTDTPIPDVDLQISMTDRGVSYLPNGILIYTVVVTNNSGSIVNSVPVAVLLPVEIVTASWTCSMAGGATCTGAGSNNINDIVNLPAYASVTYTITADIPAVGTPLNGSASVTTPGGYNETAPLDNTAAESTTALTSEINIGPGDHSWTNPGSGGSYTILLETPITSDFIYYERYAPGSTDHVDLDWVQILISQDGITWHQVFYWGDPPPPGTSDTNTNVALPVGGECPTEADNCSIHGLYNDTGITINITSLGLSGSYPWIQINCPGADTGSDGCDIDSIEP
jgi:hypothetical protein